MEFLRPKDVTRKMKISRPLLYNLIRDNLFPKPKKIGNMSVWLDSEVEKVMTALFRGIEESKIKEIVAEIERSRASN